MQEPLFFAHNHPSGIPQPSRADRIITEKLVNLLGELGVRVLDHIVVGIEGAVSLSEKGLM